MTQTHISFTIGDGDSLPYILSRLIGHTITVTMRNALAYTGDIVDPYDAMGAALTITTGAPVDDNERHERTLFYDLIEAIEYE